MGWEGVCGLTVRSWALGSNHMSLFPRSVISASELSGDGRRTPLGAVGKVGGEAMLVERGRLVVSVLLLFKD